MPTACRAPSRRCLAPQDDQHRWRLCRDVARRAAVEAAGNAKFCPSSLIIPIQCEAASAIRVAALADRVEDPPRHYGPWEQFASLLTEGLVAAGNHVTLFATADSITAASLHATAPCGWSEDATIDAKVAECLHVASVFERAASSTSLTTGSISCRSRTAISSRHPSSPQSTASRPIGSFPSTSATTAPPRMCR
jgi:hypothetical protein